MSNETQLLTARGKLTSKAMCASTPHSALDRLGTNATEPAAGQPAPSSTYACVHLLTVQCHMAPAARGRHWVKDAQTSTALQQCITNATLISFKASAKSTAA